MDGIFVSYRRSDSQGEAGRVFDDLVKHFGENAVFMDVAAIEAGRDFRKAIEEGVTKCGVLLVMIGPEWLEAKDERGARRLNDPSDFVRIETASALRRDIPVIPVLVRSARMPSAEQLPDDLKELAFRNCIELSHPRWKSDIQLLVEALRRLLGTDEAKASEGLAGQEHASTPPLKSNDASAAQIDAADLERLTRELAVHIGPIADIVVRRAAVGCKSIEELYLNVAAEIESAEERNKFLARRAIWPVAGAPAIAKEASERSEPPTASRLTRRTGDGEATTETAPTAPNSKRQNYFLLAGGLAAALILILLLAAHFGLMGRAPSQQVRASPPQAQPAEPPATKISAPETSAPSHEPSLPRTDEAPERTASAPIERVHVPAQVERNLLVSTASPTYPVVARQARIEGTVVLDADISKDGIVEDLKAISGPPLLIGSALDAAKQFRYKPYVRNGEPVAVRTQILIDFALKGG